jgi:uncharacterized protein YwgA
MTRYSTDWYRAAANIVRDAGGKIVGRTKLQKVAYLLELAGLGDGFDFEYRHYGPFSEDLAESIQMAAAFNLVLEEERRADWGGTYSVYIANSAIISTQRNTESSDRATFAQAAAQIGAIELELAATAAYLRVVERASNPWEETKRLKPEKATSTRITAAKRAYRSLKELHLGKPLPEL